jgi:histidinol-phosphate aminotransferase
MKSPKASNLDRPVPLPYVAEGPEYTPGRMSFGDKNKVFKLCSNESPMGVSPKVIDAIKRTVAEQHLYPEADGGPLAYAIGKKYNLDPAQILVGPGSDQIINWIVRGWLAAGDEVVYSNHGFQTYRIRTVTAGATAVAAPESAMRTDIEAMLRAVTDRTKIIFIANPNNPTGTYLTRDEVIELRSRLRSNILLVIDEAYYEYVDRPDYRSAIELVNGHGENTIVTRTFSKFFGMAGIRAGWAFAPSWAMGAISRVRGPFTISKFGLESAAACLQDTEYHKASFAHNKKWLPWLRKEIRSLGFEATDSVTNFVLMKIPGGTEAALEFDKKLRDLGFIGRLANQNNLPDWLRLTIGTEKAMIGLVAALKKLSQP